MKFSLPTFLPRLPAQVWILAFGRLLSQVGTGFTLFYAPIFFVNQVGLSATQVGLGIGSASISGVVGRAMGGSFTDSVFWGRRRTLLLSAVISAIAPLPWHWLKIFRSSSLAICSWAWVWGYIGPQLKPLSPI